MRHSGQRASFVRNVAKSRELLLMLLLPVAFLLVNNYFPMVGVIIAFKNYNFALGMFGSHWNGLRNFRYLFATQDAWIITRNTIGFNVLFIVLNTVVPVTLALLLNELRARMMKRIYQTSMLFPYFLSMVMVSYLVYAMLATTSGVMNKVVLPLFGLSPVSWYQEPKYWSFIIPIIYTWKYAGYTTVIYLASLAGINPEYYEAIACDGGGKWKQVRYVSLPFLQPLIIILAVLAVGRIFNSDFGLFYQVPLQSGALFPVTNVIDTYVYRALTQTNDIAMAAAAGFYQSVVGFVLVLVTNMIIRRVNPERALL